MSTARVVVLARVVGPRSFGTFAAVFAFAAAGSLIAELGLRPYLMHRGLEGLAEAREVTQLAVLSALFAALALAALAHPISLLYHDSQTVGVTLALAVWVFIGGLSVVPNAVLRIRRDFRGAAAAQIAGEFVGLVTGIASAAAGARVGALVAALLVNQVVSTMAAAWLSRTTWTPSALVATDGAAVRRRAIRYGVTVTAGATLWIIALQGDNVTVGRVGGAAALGLYAFAYNYGLLPGAFVGSTVSDVALVSFSQAIGEGERQQLFLRFVRVGAVASTPLVALGLVLASPGTRFLLGDTWAPATHAVQVMLVVGWVRGLLPTESLLRSMGRVGIEPRFGLVAAPLTIVAAFVGARSSVTAAAASVGVVLTAAGLAVTLVAIRGIHLRFYRVAAAVVPSMAIAGIFATAVGTAANALAVSPAVATLALGPIGLVGYGITLRRTRADAWNEFVEIIRPTTPAGADSSTTLVVLSHFGWDTAFMQFHKALGAELAARGLNVVWVDERVRLRTVGAARWLRAWPSGIASREGAMWRLRPWTLPGERFNERLALPARLVARSIRHFLRTKRFGCDILLSYTPMENPIVRKLRPRALVYWTGDEVIMQNEDWLVRSADVILAVSDLAFMQKNDAAPGRTHRVSTGVSTEQFADNRIGPTPDDVEALPRPIFGYVGGVSPRRIDIRLIQALAVAEPEASIVLIGPEESEFSDLSALPPNVVRMGARAFEQIPTYLAAFDVGLVPYLLNSFNLASDPLKVHEYLAAGLPVVATDLPACSVYSGLVGIARDERSFCELAKAAASTRHRPELIAARKGAAASHGIDAVADRIMRIFADRNLIPKVPR